MGDLNILLSVPHDGMLEPSTITTRITDSSNNLKNDYNTRKFAYFMRDEFKALFQNKSPFLVINNLHRIKMDPNR